MKRTALNALFAAKSPMVAFDSVNREKLWIFMKKKSREKGERNL